MTPGRPGAAAPRSGRGLRPGCPWQSEAAAPRQPAETRFGVDPLRVSRVVRLQPLMYPRLPGPLERELRRLGRGGETSGAAVTTSAVGVGRACSAGGPWEFPQTRTRSVLLG